jgi:hypothetical protein
VDIVNEARDLFGTDRIVTDVGGDNVSRQFEQFERDPAFAAWYPVLVDLISLQHD